MSTCQCYRSWKCFWWFRLHSDAPDKITDTGKIMIHTITICNMSWFHNDIITQQLMIPDQQPKHSEWDSSRDGLPAAFIISHNTKQHALGSKQQMITLHKYAAVSRDHKHPSWEDISSNAQQVSEQTSTGLLRTDISSKPTSARVTTISICFVSFTYFFHYQGVNHSLKHQIYSADIQICVVPAETFTVDWYWTVLVTRTHHCAAQQT